MKRWMVVLGALVSLGGMAMTEAKSKLEYGQFSVSLNVRDIQKSFDFYSTLGFRKVAGDLKQKWIILTNDSAVIGLFQDEWDSNVMTFNPKDVRSLHRELKSKGIAFEKEPQGTSGPAHAIFKDPDGNLILLDQHY